MAGRGAAVGVVTQGNITAMLAAAANKQLAALRVCIAAPGGAEAVNTPNNSGDTALAYAAATGSTAEAQLLLAHGADVNLGDEDNDAPLMRAAQASGDAGREVAEVLLDAGAKVNNQNQSQGATALHFACMNSNVEVVKLLLARGAAPRLEGNMGDAAAYAARAVRKEEVLAALQPYM